LSLNLDEFAFSILNQNCFFNQW